MWFLTFPLSLSHTHSLAVLMCTCVFLCTVKYGVVSREDISRDLLHWDQLYLSGRLHVCRLTLFLFLFLSFSYIYIYHTRTRTHLTDLYYHKSVRNLSTASTTICRYVFIYVYLHLSCRWSQNIIIKMLPLFVDLWNLFKFPRFLY